MMETLQSHSHPWRGANYCRGLLAGLRVLIFGESAPRKVGDERMDPRGISTERVEEYLEHLREEGDPSVFQFFSTIDGIIFAALKGAAVRPANTERCRIWNAVSFTNLIPGLVDGNPTAEQWSKVAVEFTGHVRALRPHLVLAFSSQGDKHISESIRQDGSTESSRYIDITKNEGLKCPKQSKAYIFGHDDEHRTLYGNIFHPRGILPRRYTRFNEEGWAAWVEQLIGWARQLKNTGYVTVGDKVF